MSKEIKIAEAKSTRVRVGSPKTPVAGMVADVVQPRMDYNFAAVVEDRADFPRGTGEAISSALTRNHSSIVNMCRHAYRMNGIGARAVDVPTAFVLGTGLQPSIPDNDADLMRLWNRWKKNAVAEGVRDFHAGEALAWREMMIGGESFVRLRYRTGESAKSMVVPFQVQVMPTEMVPTETTFSKNAKAGMLMSAAQLPEFYYVYKTHPGDRSDLIATLQRHTMKVPANEILHVMVRREAGALRGEPWLMRALVEIHDLKKYLGADLVKKVLAANIAYWIKMPDLTDEEKEYLSSISYDPSTGKYYDAEDNEVTPPQEPIVKAPKDGTVATLPAGADVKVTDPAESGNTFSPFVRQIGMHIAAAVNTPLAYLLTDVDGLNDRIYKGISQQYERQVKVWRRDFVSQFHNPIWNTWLRIAVAEGKWKVPAGKTIEDFMDPEWVGQPMPNLHRAQEVSSWRDEIDMGIASESDIMRRQGDDPERVRRERLDDLKKNIQAGLEPIPAHWTNKMIKLHLEWSEEEIAEYRSLTVVQVTE